MTPKPVHLGDAARLDVRAGAFACRTEAGEAVAFRFTQAVERALGHIGGHPDSGSPRYGHVLDLPGLRVWPVRRFPYLVFYVEAENAVVVWRILHASRDIPATLLADDG
ncbi:type II toxin-antitoxin system RelE/ParE family toxin [Amaricoccus sp.]|uniref:type II toxin-antitoxin system RelE/ParE family toxin n=1 Tax=Amaricoccus sp. TaxID=1872485 RepID=UPI001B55F5C8|nr:type II toxin-antitoxin system RelE/ParE family toxin [Amaricoccus sp.]MBP7241332.1 type II toxin-antitoxin system RelE/ParE family toxin [Amaricoccus sp.]